MEGKRCRVSVVEVWFLFLLLSAVEGAVVHQSFDISSVISSFLLLIVKKKRYSINSVVTPSIDTLLNKQ